MFRQIVTTIFLLAFVSQTFDKVLIVVDYYTNTTAYAKNCENKTRPQMHCNGKCQMMKKLKEEEKKEQSTTERRLGLNEVVSSGSFFTFITDRESTIITPSYFYTNSGRPIDKSYIIFHPPQTC
jgi:hypothetical protein